MSLDDVLQTTRGGNDDLGTRTEVELLLFDGTLEQEWSVCRGVETRIDDAPLRR